MLTYNIPFMNISHFVYSIIEYTNYFQILSIFNNAAINILRYSSWGECVYVFLLSLYLRVKLVGQQIYI